MFHQARGRGCGWRGHFAHHEHHHHPDGRLSETGRHHSDEETSVHGDMLFGVRRPLRFMAHKLELDEAQIATLARILRDLKNERAQAAVDLERSIARVADALEGEGFDEAAAQAALEVRVASAQRLRDAVQAALRASHQMLRPDQRRKLAYLLRSGVLTI